MEFIEQYHCEVIAKFYDVSSCKVSSYVSGSSSYYGKINEDDKLRLINKRVEEALAEYNSVIVITGNILHAEVLDVFTKAEQKYIKRNPQKFLRPFTNYTVPNIEKQVHEESVPADDNSIGFIEIAWVGGKNNDIYKNIAFPVLMDYLCKIYGSPLYKYFVETNICSSISMEFIEQYHCEVIAKFHDVGSCKGSCYVRGIIIENHKCEFRQNIEENPHTIMTDVMIIGSFELNSQEIEFKNRIQKVSNGVVV
uniref:Peptidase M16 C-terminal domain-containing protein n=1 Tax=Meloidogyne floridensis TaxID=298350 RepID=A0A915NE39_9BILA